MGIYLSSPDKTKHNHDGSSDHLIYGATEMQGWRKTMEDSWITEILPKSESGNERSLFAVFDGHGGNQVAEFVRDYFVKELLDNENFKTENYEAALTETFCKMDEMLIGESGDAVLKKYTKKETDSSSFNAYSGMEADSNIATCCGCTACVVLIVGDTVFCANAGDSRCVLSEKGSAVAMSDDHKPSCPEEEKRIKDAGGFVSMDRVNGNLNLSRALGDFTYKENKTLGVKDQMVIPIPEIRTHTITSDSEFFIIACDGIWDWMNNQMAVDFIKEKYDELKTTHGDTFKASDINVALFDRNLAKDTFGNVGETGKEGAGCDNMTSVVVFFKHGKSGGKTPDE